MESKSGEDKYDGSDSDDDSPFLSLPTSNESLSSPTAHSKSSHVSLDLRPGFGGRPSADSSTSDSKSSSPEALIKRGTESRVLVVFDLPDGSQLEESFQRGQTVEVLKSFVATNAGIPMEGQRLYVTGRDGAEQGGRLLMDPMSMGDYKEFCDEGGEVYVRVEGDMEDDLQRK
jgi:hypothetical protein